MQVKCYMTVGSMIDILTKNKIDLKKGVKSIGTSSDGFFIFHFTYDSEIKVPCNEMIDC